MSVWSRLWRPWPMVAVVLLAVVGCTAAVRPARGSSGADLVVRDFCQRFGRSSGLAILNLFADSARFDLEGLGVSFVGRHDLARLVDYGVAVHSRLSLREVESDGEVVSCRLEESNEWLGLLGVERATYDGRFRVVGARIAEARIGLTPESQEALATRLPGFLAWLLAKDPKAASRLFPGGRPSYDRSVIPELLARLKEWRSRSR